MKVREALEAIEKNGYRKVRKAYVKHNSDESKILGACAIGQGALNLGIHPESFSHKLDNVHLQNNEHVLPEYRKTIFHSGVSLSSFIILLNDNTHRSVPAVAKAAKKQFEKYLDWEI